MTAMTTNLAEMPTSKVIDLAEARFATLAPKSIKFEAEKGYALQLLQNNSYLARVAEENKLSLLHAVTNCAAIGLSLNPAKKEAYLITRTVNEGGKFISKVFLEPSYQGLCNLATNTGSIEWVQANVVYSNDEFTDNGPGEKPTHKYDAFATKDRRGDFVGVYCTAKTHGGDYLTTIMPADEVYSIRDRSEAYKAMIERKKGNGGPWVSDFAEMAKKSVVRRGVKMWPKTEQFDRIEAAVMMSNDNEGFEPLKTSPSLGSYTAEQKQYFDQLITSNDAIGMFCFLKSIDEQVYISLYNSFEKGSIGKCKKIVGDLEVKGGSLVSDCIAAINDSAQQDDTHGIIEVISDMTDDAIKFIADRVSREAAAMIRTIQQGE
jgi:recombination protein RecT